MGCRHRSAGAAQQHTQTHTNEECARIDRHKEGKRAVRIKQAKQKGADAFMTTELTTQSKPSCSVILCFFSDAKQLISTDV